MVCADLTRRLDRHGEAIRAAIESMNGARFVHDRLELAGWQVEIADAQKVKGLARWPARPTASTPGCSPSSRAGSGARDLAAGPARSRRAGARSLATAPGPPPLQLETARARGAAHPRQALPRLRSVRRPRPPAARPARTPRQSIVVRPVIGPLRAEGLGEGRVAQMPIDSPTRRDPRGSCAGDAAAARLNPPQWRPERAGAL
jgi:hypothetical protein